MKKIAFFSGDITRSGGTERVGTLIANALAERENYEIFMVSLTHEKSEPGFELAASIRRDALSGHWVTPGPGYVPVIFRLKKYVEQNGINLIIDIDGVLDVLSIPVKWMTGADVISWEHFNYYENMGTRYRPWIRRLAARYADAIVTLTEQDRGFYEKNLNIRHEIKAIHNPADYLAGSPKTQGRSFQKKELLSVGGFSTAKRFDKIPHIAQLLEERYPELDFIWRIAGEGMQRSVIEQQIAARSMSHRVKLLGHVKDVEKLYAQALVYVMTSDREGLPMVLLEAKQYGLPSVSYDIRTGPAEIIENGVNGYLIPVTGNEPEDAAAMADAIGRLLTDEALYRSFARHAGDHMEDFSMDHVIGQWVELIERL